MGIGTVNIASTPCCGLIQRSYDCHPDENSSTGWTHDLGGDYTPTVEDCILEMAQLEKAICPDCGGKFLQWLIAWDVKSGPGDFSLAQNFFIGNRQEKRDMLSHFPLKTIVNVFRELNIPLAQIKITDT